MSTEHLWPADAERSFPLRSDDLVYSTVRVVEGKEPITDVHHDADGDWQFLDADGPLDPSTVVKVHFACILDEHPEIVELAHLQEGWYAWRDGPGQPWHQQAFADEDATGG